MRSPTARQLEVFQFIRDYRARHQRPPTLMDLALHFHINRNAARCHVRALEQKQLLTRAKGLHRAMAVLA